MVTVHVKLADYRRWSALATDFVLTAPEVWTAGERLTSTEQLVAFLSDHDLVAAPVSDSDVDAVRELRRHLRALFDERNNAERVAGASRLTADAFRTVGVDIHPVDTVEWTLELSGDRAIDLLRPLCALGILGTIRALGHNRIRDCAAPTCNGAFIDTSRGGQRRYCMPELCGNRTNVASHRRRTLAQNRSVIH